MNSHKTSQENLSDSKESKDPNESISDSLAKVIREYDRASQLLKRSIWSRKKVIPAIVELRKELSQYSGGFLESEQRLLEAIRKIIIAAKPKLNTKEPYPPIDNALAYLEERLKYHDQKQRRMPQALTAEYKILLIGDGWVRREDPGNPLIIDINQDLNSANEKVRALATLKQYHLKLENRGYTPDQVYTVDRLSTSLPDIVSALEELTPEDLPKACFDFAYLEGFSLNNEEEMKSAVNVVLTFVKEDGLILYSTPGQQYDVILLAKSGEITRDKLDKIPKCIKISADFHLENFASFEEIVPNGAQQINLKSEARAIKKLSPG